MTNAGEYLLSLPQLLEAIAEAREEESLSLSLAQEEEGGVPEGGGSSGSIDAGEWMADVAEAAAGLLLAHARGVEALAEPGAAQMGADVEYFVNVVAALSLEPPPQLVAYAACCRAEGLIRHHRERRGRGPGRREGGRADEEHPDRVRRDDGFYIFIFHQKK